MKFSTRGMLLAFLVLPVSNIVFGQAVTEKTLLWRISGKNLEHSSYLFGTMHLYDKRLFNFGDSVYNSILNTDGFAMELDPQELADSILGEIKKGDTTALLKDLLEDKQFRALSSKLESQFSVPAEKVTRKMLADRRNVELFRRRKKDDMTTVVDLYLYNVARSQGKWTGGIEDYADQGNLLNELSQDISISDILDNDGHKSESELQEMIRVYVSEDLGKINTISSKNGERYTELILANRNRKMSRRIDSLSAIRSTFFAVGAAHLPGAEGIITLLRTRGFKVEPVYSSRKTKPSEFHFDLTEQPWVDVMEKDSMYFAKMPVTPTDMQTPSNSMEMKMAADIATNNFYLTGFAIVDSNETIESRIKALDMTMINGNMADVKKIRCYNGKIEGREIRSQKDNVSFRVQIYLTGQKLFMIAMGSMIESELYRASSENFFSGFVMNLDKPVKANSWMVYTNPGKAFKIHFPGNPEVTDIPKNDEDSHMHSQLLKFEDLRSNSYYMLVVNEVDKGYVMGDDSVFLNDKLSQLRANKIVTNLEYKARQFKGYPAFDIYYEIESKDEKASNFMLLVLRGNRNYSLLSITPYSPTRNKNVVAFEEGLDFLEPIKNNWNSHMLKSMGATAWLPEAFTVDSTSVLRTAATSETAFQSYDQHSGNTFYLTVYPISKYYWTVSDSAYFNDVLEDSYGISPKGKTYGKDSLVYFNYLSNPVLPGCEFLQKLSGGSLYRKVRILRSGDSAYHLMTMALPEDFEDENMERFFSDFELQHPSVSDGIFQNKTDLILRDLIDTTTATRNAARDAVTKASFTSMDVPKLIAKLFFEFPYDSFGVVNYSLAEGLLPFLDDSLTQSISKKYFELAPGEERVRMAVLEMLARKKTDIAYSALGRLYSMQPPQTNDNSYLAGFLTDSLELTQKLFPQLLPLLGDTFNAPVIIRLMDHLNDSSMMQTEVLKQNEDAVREAARQVLAKYLRGTNYPNPHIFYLLSALNKINTEEADNLLNDFLQVEQPRVKIEIIKYLLTKKKKVSPDVLTSLAGEKSNRFVLFEALNQVNQGHLFPKKFKTRRFFSESDIYNYVTDFGDYDWTAQMIFLTDVKLKKHSGNKHVLLYNIMYADGTSEIALAGPYPGKNDDLKAYDDDVKVKTYKAEGFPPKTPPDYIEKLLTDSQE